MCMMAVCAPLLPTDDTTRVVLKNVEDEAGADYINANHLAVSTYHHVCWEGVPRLEPSHTAARL